MTTPARASDCEFCNGHGGTVLWRDSACRVVLANEPDYPGFCRVIWEDHVKEMTDLDAADRAHLMQVVFGVEQVLRELLAPDKINLASIGNFVPHLHWHVIPRYRNDPHFPQTVWAARQRDGSAPAAGPLAATASLALTRALQPRPPPTKPENVK